MKYSFRSRSRLAWLFLQLHKLYVKIVIHGSLFLVGASFLIADPPSTLVDPKDTKGISFVQPSVALREDVTLSYSYLGDADLHAGLGGSLGEQTTLFGYGLMLPLNDQLSLHFGLNYNRLDFGQPSGRHCLIISKRSPPALVRTIRFQTNGVSLEAWHHE
jgi:hypothetical protein